MSTGPGGSNAASRECVAGDACSECKGQPRGGQAKPSMGGLSRTLALCIDGEERCSESQREPGGDATDDGDGGATILVAKIVFVSEEVVHCRIVMFHKVLR